MSKRFSDTCLDTWETLGLDRSGVERSVYRISFREMKRLMSWVVHPNGNPTTLVPVEVRESPVGRTSFPISLNLDNGRPYCGPSRPFKPRMEIESETLTPNRIEPSSKDSYTVKDGKTNVSY